MDRKLEKFMRESCLELPKNSIYYKAMEQSHHFWQAQDYYRKSNKAKIFRLIYMTDNGKSSLLRNSRECYVDERTLFRYRNDFIQMYKYFLNILQEQFVV